ncbi:hypothetical protein E4U42_005937 [Claviceps africana]|uniref:Annexin ANXC4 n=1 Tax=Claviceps africana TaxID=83212 RepID=A0A8K0NJN6_9HYPO|nr:hypothetical protein E4U42_005937 [Claviceps africana]
MSLAVPLGHKRDRSRSRDGRSRSRDGRSRSRDGRSRSRDGRSRSRDHHSGNEPRHSSISQVVDTRESSHVYPEDHLDGRYQSRGQQRESTLGGGGGGGGGSLPYPLEELGGMLPGSQSLYYYPDARPIYPPASPLLDTSFLGFHGRVERENTSQLPGAFPEEDRSRKHHASGGPRYDGKMRSDNVCADRLACRNRDGEYFEYDADGRGGSNRDARSKKERDEDDLAYGKLPGPSRHHRSKSPRRTYGSYIYRLDHADKHSSRHGRGEDKEDRREKPLGTTVDRRHSPRSRHEPSHRREPHDSGANVLSVESRGRDRDRSRERRRDKSSGPSLLAPESARKERDRSRSRRGASRDRSPQPPTARMSNLTVDHSLSNSTSLSAAPPSPLLEAYRGTYQECSPMPSPLLVASKSPDMDHRFARAPTPIFSDVGGDGERRGRRARFHDPEDVASQLARALKGSRAPDTQPLVEILPSLTHEQVMELRSQYKRIVKTGSARKGVNIAKHIHARLKDENPNLMKACYAVALGKWESEAYWANFWYRGDKTRRELLIESLMGRTNAEIRQIKDAFTDKKYDNSLTKCMKTELKEDKFKKAVLMVLEEHRMDDFDASGCRIPLDHDLVDEDVSNLRKAVRAEKGGESAMIGIVVHRSDAHLRVVLQEYERLYQANFAKEALNKSSNLVGELLAHILNGVINRPVRDALLLNHALTASRKDGLRRELLISRLVRFHWDPLHMQAVKKAYLERYRVDLSEAVREGTRGAWGQFCRELCIVRMPERVEIIH